MSDRALDVMAALVLEDGRRWGEAAVFQWQDARAVLDPASSTPYNFLTRSRGGSKTSDLAGMTLAAMLMQLPAGSRSYALAADRDQGRLLVDAVAGYATRTPELRGALELAAYRVTATRSGSTLDVLAADAPSAWGLRPAFLVVDELAAWGTTGVPRRLWEAVTSAVAKRADARLVVLTTAGDPAHWSRKVLEHALADPLWRVHEGSRTRAVAQSRQARGAAPAPARLVLPAAVRASSTAGAAEARTPPPALCALPRRRCAHGLAPERARPLPRRTSGRVDRDR